MYSPGVVDLWQREADDDSVEVWLDQQVDTPAAPPIRALVGGASLADLSPDELSALAKFIAAQDMRTPIVRDLLVPELSRGAAEAGGDARAAQRALGRRGRVFSLAHIERVSQELQPYLRAQGKAGWLKYIEDQLPSATRNVTARTMTVLDAPEGHEFITSDVGIVKAVGGFASPAVWEGGTIGGRFSWLMPLCPARGLAVTDAALPPPPPLTESGLAGVNRQLLLDAREFVYARGPISADLLAGLPAAASVPVLSIRGAAAVRRQVASNWDATD
jgi:hypothetical protein